MDDKSIIWPIVKTFGCALLAFVFAFPLSDYAELLVYPWIASFEVLFNITLRPGTSLYDFVYVLILVFTIYFLFSFFYFLTKMLEWIINHVRK